MQSNQPENSINKQSIVKKMIQNPWKYKKMNIYNLKNIFFYYQVLFVHLLNWEKINLNVVRNKS